LIAYWNLSPNGWLTKLGSLDFAGGTTVHITAGFSSLAYIENNKFEYLFLIIKLKLMLNKKDTQLLSVQDNSLIFVKQSPLIILKYFWAQS
jgi:hypothetical protein